MLKKYSIITLTQETLKSGLIFESGAEQKYKIPWRQADPAREQLAIFKIDNEPRPISRVWIEKLAGELAISMGLPTATYEMCETKDNRRGIASPSYLKTGRIEQPGIVLMQEVFETNSVLYTVENALTVFDRLDINLPSGYTLPPEIGTAKDLFIGYLLHSYWIDDPDFHARNWGIQINPDGKRELLPNYDYGRALVDFPVVNNRLEIFAERLAETRTCAFVNNDGKEIKMDKMVEILNHISPNITQYWSNQIAQASAEQLNSICDLFPAGWGSPDRIEFARVFINYSSQRLAQLTEAPSQIVLEIENLPNSPDDSPEPPNDPPEPPSPRNPPNPPKPPTPPNSPDPGNSPDPLSPSTDSPSISTSSNQSSQKTNMGIKLISYDLLNRRPETLITSDLIRSQIVEGTGIEQLMKRKRILPKDEPPTFYIAKYNKYLNVDDLTNQAPAGTVLLATSSAQLYFGAPEVKAAIKTLMPLETQIPGYARGLFAEGQSQPLERPMRVLVVNDRTGENNSGIPPKLIRNIVADGSSAIDRSIGEQMELVEATGLAQVRGFSLDPNIGSYYIKGTVTPLNIKNYFASHNLDIDVDLILSESMLKGVNIDKNRPKLGICEVDSRDLFITRTNNIRQTTAKIGSVQELYSTGLAKDAVVQTQIEIQKLQQRQVDVISLAEDYVEAYKNIQSEDRLKGKIETELPENVLFIEAILESRNWGLLELPNVRRNLEDYITAKIDDIKAGNIHNLRGEYRPIVISGDLKHNQIAGVGLTTGDRHVALRFPVLNRGQVQAIEVNNDIPIFKNPDLGAIIPDAIYIGYQSLAEIEQDDPEAYQAIITEFGSVKAAELSWRTNLEAMKADFDGDTVVIFSEAKYPNFYQEVVENLKPDKLMHFVSKDEKKLIQSENLPEMVVERLKNYVGIVNSNLTDINRTYASLDFILQASDGRLTAAEKREADQLKFDTLKIIFDSSQIYKDQVKSLVEPDTVLSIKVPRELEEAFQQIDPFYSIEFIKEQSTQAKINYLMKAREAINLLLDSDRSRKSEVKATPINSKIGVTFNPKLRDAMEQLKYMRLTDIKKGVFDAKFLDTYLDDYAVIYGEISKIIDLSQPVTSITKDINPDTNLQDLITIDEINIIPNRPYDPNQIDQYLRDYQNIVLRKAIELVDQQNQRSVDFVKSGVKPDEGRVYSVTHKIPDLKLDIDHLQDIIIKNNHQDRLAKSSNLTINSLLVQLRPASVTPEIKAVVDIFRSSFHDINLAIKKEERELKLFKHGKPIVLSIKTENNDEIVVNKCSVNGMKMLRELEGKGSISFDDSEAFFISANGSSYLLGGVSKETKQFNGSQTITNFEFQLLYDRIAELKEEKREILNNFRDIIEARGWDKQEVFTGIAQMVGEKAVSYNFLVCALPETLREFVIESGTNQILVKTDRPELLTERTKFFVTSNNDGSRKLRAEVEENGKKNWITVGNLEAYGSQVLAGTTFDGRLKPHYNQINIKGTIDNKSESLTVGKITNIGRKAMDNPNSIENIKIVKVETPNFVLNLGETKIPIIDMAPEIVDRLNAGAKIIHLESITVYGDAFNATTLIDDRPYYLSGKVTGALSSTSKKNWQDFQDAPDIADKKLESVDVKIDKISQNSTSLYVYNNGSKIGEITQKTELTYWRERFRALASNEINLSVKSLDIKQVGYQVVIDKDTLNNQNLWLDVEPAKTYTTGAIIKTEAEKAQKTDELVKIRAAANKNLQRKANDYCFPPSFSSKLLVPRIDENGFKEVEILQLLVPVNKLDDVEEYLKDPKYDIKYSKLEGGIPATYEESRRGYTVIQILPEDLTTGNKIKLSQILGKPTTQAKYQDKLASVPVIYDRVPLKLQTLKKTLAQHPPSNLAPSLDLDRVKPVPYRLRPITEEVLTRFKGRGVEIDASIVFEFATKRQRDAAIHHLNLPIRAQLSSDGKDRYFAIVETGALQTYINDRAVIALSTDGLDRNNSNPILNVYAEVKQLSSLSGRSQMDIMMGFKANKYIGIPLTETKNMTQLFRDSWGEKANTIGYNSNDTVMVTGNRSNANTSPELLAHHFHTQYLPLVDAAVKAKATLLFGTDGGIDTLLKTHIEELGYDLSLNSAGVFEAKSKTSLPQLSDGKLEIETTPIIIVVDNVDIQSEGQAYY